MKKITYLIVASLLILMFFLGLFSLAGDSGTTDEVAHIPAGYSYLKFQDYRLNPEHPPLLKALSAIPLLFMDLKFPQDHICWTEDVNGQWECGWEFIYRLGNNADMILFWSRIPVLLFALVLGIYVFKFAKEVFGEKIGLFALFFYVLSPNILAHSRLVTTDLAVTATFFISIFYFYKFIKNPSWKYLIATSISFGLAQLVKFSNILLPIYMILLLFVCLFVFRDRISFKFPLLRKIKNNFLRRFYFYSTFFILVCLIGFIMVWACYGFFTAKMPAEKVHLTIDGSIYQTDGTSLKIKQVLHQMTDISFLKPAAYYLLGLKMVMARVAGGNTTYFLGQTSNQAWWYYYPVSFIIKTPIPTLILFFCSIFFLAWGIFKFYKKVEIPSAKRKLFIFFERIFALIRKYFVEFICLSVISMFFMVGIKGNLNIGLRHILPLYPFMFILSAKYLNNFFFSRQTKSWFIKKKKFWPKIKCGLGMVLMIWYVLANFFVFPSYLAYFNEFIGGTKNGWKYTVDSNTDWGQDLKRLASWVEKNKIEHIKVDYFGGSIPGYYLGEKQEKWMSKFGETEGWLAVSATYYQNSKYYAKTLGEPDYSWLDKYEPVEIIGGSILVYYIEPSA